MSLQNQPEVQPQTQQQQSQSGKSLEEIQLAATCNWCRNLLVMTENFGESNFVDIGRKWHADDTANAEAVYCGDCHGDTFRVSSPKAVIDRETLNTCNVDELPSLT